MIENYIMNISEQINKQYNGLMVEEIVAQINILAESVVNNYIEQMKKRLDPELVKENHKKFMIK